MACIPASRSQKRWILCGVFIFFLLVIFALNDTMTFSLPFLLWFRSDACKVWKVTDVSYEQTEGFSAWQRLCLIEKDWNSMDYLCRDVRLMGNWPVCFDEPYTPVRKGKPCIVYSFGIANDFRFDDAMAYHNCTVFSFDPSMSQEDHQRSRQVFFKKLGIGAADRDDFVPRTDGYTKPGDRWKIMKFSSIMKSLGHTIDSVSLVKIDVESNEWPILKNLLAENILQHLPQVLIEWHLFTDQPPASQYEDIHSDYLKFRRLGFKKFWMRNEGHNHWLPKMESQAETAWINTGFQIKKS